MAGPSSADVAVVNVRIGTAPDSWGVWFSDHPLQIPWRRFLDEVQEAGYEAIELGPLGYLPTDTAVLQGELRARGIQLAGAYVYGDLWAPRAWQALRGDVERLCEILGVLGAQHLVLVPKHYTDLISGALIDPRKLSDDGWKRLADTCNEIGRFTLQQGIAAVFHPDAESPVEFEPQIDRLLASTDPASVGLCLDFGHHLYCAGDPVAFVLRHRDRLKHLHLKNTDPVVGPQVRRDGTPFSEAVRQGVFTDLELGEGDFVGLKAALVEIGYDGWGIVEQDMFPAPFDQPLPIAKRNRDYLRRIGMG